MSASMHMVGSVQVPTSWTSTTSANATVAYTSPLLISGSSTSVTPASPLSISTGSGGGDGYNPIIYNSPDGKTKRFFEIYHHQFGTASINCQNFSDGKACTGYPKALTDTATNTRLSTSNWVRTVIIGNKIYFPAAVGNKTVGIGCWDASTDSDCAYIPIDNKADTGNDKWNQSWVGVIQDPGLGKTNQLYLTQAGTLYCWDVGTNKACAANVSLLAAAGHFDSTKDQGHTDLLLAGTAANLNSRMFLLINGWLTCRDLSTATTCASAGNVWPVQVETSNNNQFFNMLLHYLDSAGNVIGACASRNKAAPACYDTAGNSLTPPGLLSSISTGWYMGSSAVLGTRVYYAIPFYPNFGNGQSVCWDFATNAACAGFTDGGAGATLGVRRWAQPNAGSTAQGIVGPTDDYGYKFEGQCGYGLGDKGTLWSFDASTGAAPCAVTNSDITVPDPKAFCDGLDHGSNWGKIQLNNTPIEVQTVAIKVYDAAACPVPNDASNCTVLAKGDLTKQLSPIRPLWDIPFVAAVSNGLSLKNHPSIRVSMTYTFANGKAPTTYNNFSATTLYTPDATTGAIGQVCMRAQVNNCPASVIDNQAIIKRGSNGNVLGRALSTMFTGMANPVYSDTAPAVNNSVAVSGRAIYRTTYQVTDWSGDLTAYSTDSVGNPSGVLWSTSPAGAASAPAGAAQKLPSAAQRNILTTTGAGTGVSFDATSLQTTVSANILANFGGSAADQTKLINYLRGDRSLEASVGTNNPYRRRMLWDTTHAVTALGDFIHSAPVFDNGTVYAEANDGMLHAFAADTGVESFAFVPSAVFPLLKPLSDVSYVHNWIMDGQVAVAHVGTGAAAKSTLVGSTGGVKPALFGIDVSALPAIAPGPAQVVFESTDAALGRANGAIQIATLSGGTVVALLGNGMGSTGDQAQLIQVNVADGSITAINTGVGGASTPNGLSAPTPLVVGGQLVAVYAGDALGNLWRFPVSSGVIGAPTKLFTTATLQPITAAPTLSGKLTLNGKTGYYVYFGTGKGVDRTAFGYDPTTPAEQTVQALYGVFDVANSSGVPGSSGLTLSSLVQQTMGTDNKVSNNPVDLSSMNGWALNLAVGDPSKNLAAERILSPVIYNPSSNAVTVVTAIPQKSGCYNASLAGSHAINISATTGGTPSTSTIVGPTGTGNQVTITGTLGGITAVSGEPGIVNNLTSDAGGGSTLVTAGVNTDNGTVSNFNTQGAVLILKRTSWVQLY
jgi:hypothetical protein